MIVFVHGVPETARLWDRLRERIDRPSRAVSLPGFGCRRPAGFAAGEDDYTGWLAAELAAIGEPIDLVGHDWGALLTYRLAADPAMSPWLRSWVGDVANGVHPDYVWHDLARIWQTPGDGEAFFRDRAHRPVEERAAVFERSGVGRADAIAIASWSDAEMAASILGLYRSAMPNPHAHWAPLLAPTQRPGLVLHPTDDPYGDAALGAEVAAALGADYVELPGLGHWWQVQAPGVAAAVLDDFWDGLDAID